jgi:CRISPR-associated protein Cmr6
MRQVLETLQGTDGPPDHHIGLAYDTWAPTGSDGKIPEAERARWLHTLSGIAIAADYRHFFDRWKAGFQEPRDRTFELTLASRLLVGHGNASGAEVGLCVHRTWGVPVIPGSALKGLLAHYVDAVYGPADPTRPPWEQTETDRIAYQGIVWKGRRIQRGPGAMYRTLFGAPDAEEDAEMAKQGYDAGATAGLITFHDALYLPGSTDDDKPFVPDVLTVHQKTYYDSSGRAWPIDYDNPVPVAFLSVRPGAKMLLALSGPPDWTQLAARLLQDALDKWGAGAKTSAGYGRLVAPAAAGRGQMPEPAARPTPRHRRGDRVSVTRIEDPRGKIKFLADDGIIGSFASEEPPSVVIGGMVEVWIANVSPQTYTLTLKDPHHPAKGKK